MSSNYPPGSENDPAAPFNQPDLPEDEGYDEDGEYERNLMLRKYRRRREEQEMPDPDAIDVERWIDRADEIRKAKKEAKP